MQKLVGKEGSYPNKTTDLDMHHVHLLVLISTFYNKMYIKFVYMYLRLFK